MELDLNQVIIKDKSIREGYINLTVHPLYLDSLFSLTNRGDYGQSEKDLDEYLKPLVDQLWESIPGIKSLYLSNGEIHINHLELFPQKDIMEVAIGIIKPVLESNIELQKFSKEA